MAVAEQQGLQSTYAPPRRGYAYRDNERVLISDSAFADKLWAYLLQALLVDTLLVNGKPPAGLNADLRLYRYMAKPAAHIVSHCHCTSLYFAHCAALLSFCFFYKEKDALAVSDACRRRCLAFGLSPPCSNGCPNQLLNMHGGRTMPASRDRAVVGGNILQLCTCSQVQGGAALWPTH
jgi:hypothetical protein